MSSWFPLKSKSVYNMENMEKTSSTLRIVVGLLVVLIVILAGVLWKMGEEGSSGYVAVYLDTGDIYFGKLRLFPSFSLEDVWYLQVGTSQNPGVGVLPLNSVFWGPSERVYLQPKHVVWVTHLRADSPVLAAIKGQGQGNVPPAGEALPQEGSQPGVQDQ